MKKATPFDLAQKMLYLDGKPFDLSDRQYLKAIYNSPYKRQILKFGRQTEKSTTLASKMSVFGTVIPSFKSLYIAPTSKQARVFSGVRLKDFLDSPFIKKNFIDKDCAQAVFYKSLKNQSKYFLEYCFLTPDRIRGISSIHLYVDELQDILTDHLPVIEECLSHAPKDLAAYFYSGTPKSMENTIEYYWGQSTQREIAIKCQRCNFWNVGLGMANIGDEWLMCAKCKRQLSKEIWEWVRAIPLDRVPYEGFHLNQLNINWIDWEEILVKKRLYSPARFHNEVLGESYDSGLRPITKAELMACCEDRPMIDENHKCSSPLFAGIDWGLTADVSYTVLVIGEYLPYPDKFRLHYAKIYGQNMSDPRVQVEDIIKICKKFNVATIGADWGAGVIQNLRLADVFGVGRVNQFYHTGNQQERIKYNKKRWIYTTNRTFVMADLFQDFIKRKIEVFNWNDFEPFGKHILHIYSDIRKHQQKETLYYDHRPDQPDDTFHAIIFAKLAGDIFYKGRAV